MNWRTRQLQQTTAAGQVGAKGPGEKNLSPTIYLTMAVNAGENGSNSSSECLLPSFWFCESDTQGPRHLNVLAFRTP